MLGWQVEDQPIEPPCSLLVPYLRLSQPMKGQQQFSAITAPKSLGWIRCPSHIQIWTILCSAWGSFPPQSEQDLSARSSQYFLVRCLLWQTWCWAISSSWKDGSRWHLTTAKAKTDWSPSSSFCNCFSFSSCPFPPWQACPALVMQYAKIHSHSRALAFSDASMWLSSSFVSNTTLWIKSWS